MDNAEEKKTAIILNNVMNIQSIRNSYEHSIITAVTFGFLPFVTNDTNSTCQTKSHKENTFVEPLSTNWAHGSCD